MSDYGFIYNATIFKVRFDDSEDTFPFFVRQIRKENHDEFDGEIWGRNITGRFTGKSEKDVYSQIEKAIESRFSSHFTIVPDSNR